MLLYIALDRCGVALHHGEALRQLLQALEALRALRLAAERLAQRRRELGGLRGLEADQRDPRLALLHSDFHSVGGMRIDHYAELVVDLLDGAQSISVRAAAGDECRVGGWKFEFTLRIEPAVEVPDARAVAADELEHVALEVRRLGDVHRRAGRFLHVLSHTVMAGAEELVQHIVLVARQNQFSYG